MTSTIAMRSRLLNRRKVNLNLKKFCNGASRLRSMFSHAFLAVSTFSTCNLNASSQTPTATDPKAFCHPTTPQKTTKPVFNTPSFSRTYLALNIIDSTIVNSLNYLSNRNLSFPPLDPMAPVPRPNRHLNFSKWLQTQIISSPLPIVLRGIGRRNLLVSDSEEPRRAALLRSDTELMD